MEKLDSLQSALDHMKKILVSGEKGSTTHIISGKTSGGKHNLMDSLQSFATENGYVVFRFPGNILQESMPYQPFNHILNVMYDTVDERGMSDIIKKFTEYFSENAGLKFLIIIEGLERLNSSSQDLFLYISRIASRFGFHLIGTYSKRSPSEFGSGEFNFIIVSATEPQIHIINIRDPNFDDARFYVENLGYRLPESFMMDIFRLSSGDLNTINYALKYYSDIGIINEKKEVNEAMFRFLPIPPAIEDYYAKKISDLSETELRVAGTLAMSGEDLDMEVIARMTSLPKSDLYKVMSSLDSAGIISVNNFKYQISGRRLAEIIRAKVSSVLKIDVADQIINSPSFGDLSIQTRLNILRERGLYEDIGDLIRKNWKDTLNAFVSPEDLMAFLDSVIDKLDDNTKKYVSLIECNALFYLGRFDKSIECFRKNDYTDIAGREPELKVAFALSSTGRHDEASAILNSILGESKLTPDERVLGLVARASLLLRERKPKEALAIASEAMEIAKEHGVEEEMDEILTHMATANADLFKLDIARKYYKEAIDLEKKRGNIRRINRNLHDLAIIESFEGNFQKGIDMLKELLENTYINGEISIRAYALYNLMDMLHIVGDLRGSLDYKNTTDRLIEIVQDNDIKFIYYRYMTMFYAEALDPEKGLEYARKAVELSSRSENQDWKSASNALLHILSVNIGNGEVLDTKLFNPNFTSLEDFIPLYLGFWSIIFTLRKTEDKAMEAISASDKYANDMGDVSSKLTVEVSKMIFNLAFDRFQEPDPPSKYSGDSAVRKYDYSLRAYSAAKMLREGNRAAFIEESKMIVNELMDGSGLYNVILYPIIILGIAMMKFLNDNRIVESVRKIFTGSKPSERVNEIVSILRGE
jgi:tetratricopeptide (TPR) repeat protein